MLRVIFVAALLYLALALSPLVKADAGIMAAVERLKGQELPLVQKAKKWKGSLEDLIRIVPHLFDEQSEEYQGGKPSECRHYLVSGKYGSGPYGVNDDHLSASSMWDENHRPQRSRLFRISDEVTESGGTGAWSALVNDQEQYIQVQLSSSSEVTGIITMGRHDMEQWVTAYKISYSNDGTTWETVPDELTGDRVFAGNCNRDTPVTNFLDVPFTASYVRLQPLTWHTHISLRFDILGCPVA